MLSRSFWVCSGMEPACARICATRSLLIGAWTCCQPSVAARSGRGKVLEKSAAPARLDPRWSNSLRLGLDTKFEVILRSPYFVRSKNTLQTRKRKHESVLMGRPFDLAIIFVRVAVTFSFAGSFIV